MVSLFAWVILVLGILIVLGGSFGYKNEEMDGQEFVSVVIFIAVALYFPILYLVGGFQ